MSNIFLPRKHEFKNEFLDIYIYICTKNSFGELAKCNKKHIEQSVGEVEQPVKPNAKSLKRPRSHHADYMINYEWWGVCKSVGAISTEISHGHFLT